MAIGKSIMLFKSIRVASKVLPTVYRHVPDATAFGGTAKAALSESCSFSALSRPRRSSAKLRLGDGFGI